MNWYLIALACLLYWAGVLGEYEYARVNLENYCGQTVYLTCPRDGTNDPTGRVGTLAFCAVPMDNCSVSVQTPSDCNVNHAIYFNLPWARLAPGYTLEVYESVQPGSRGYLIKKIQGRADMMNRHPDSVAQLLTSYSSQKRLSFKLHLEANDTQDYPHEVIFDYTIIRRTFQSGESYCRALDGYLPSDIMCTDPNGVYRINCPTMYMPSLGITNRAFRQQACTRPTMPATTPVSSAQPRTSTTLTGVLLCTARVISIMRIAGTSRVT